MFEHCKWCDHIRTNRNGEPYCKKTGNLIENDEIETCENWELMDYAF